MTSAVLAGCIGEDVVNLEPVPPRLFIETSMNALMVNESVQVTFHFTDEFGRSTNAELDWISSNPAVIDISDQGLATALEPGQAIISANSGAVTSNQILVTAVADDMTIATIVLDPMALNLAPGTSAAITARALNINSEEIGEVQFQWISDSPAIATVDQDGVVQALTNGRAEVFAEANGIRSEGSEIMVGGAERTGDFEGRSGYKAEGMVRLFMSQGDLILELSADFDTDFALGTFIYLSNTTTGSGTRSNGLEIAEVTSDGGASFNVSDISNDEVGLDDYQYVVVLCKPASITFGVAELTN